jgi:hypothetical protein
MRIVETEKPPERHHVSIVHIGPASVPLDDIGSQPQPRRSAGVGAGAGAEQWTVGTKSCEQHHRLKTEKNHQWSVWAEKDIIHHRLVAYFRA